jgi:hypothetical protein
MFALLIWPRASSAKLRRILSSIPASLSQLKLPLNKFSSVSREMRVLCQKVHSAGNREVLLQRWLPQDTAQSSWPVESCSCQSRCTSISNNSEQMESQCQIFSLTSLRDLLRSGEASEAREGDCASMRSMDSLNVSFGKNTRE